MPAKKTTKKKVAPKKKAMPKTKKPNQDIMYISFDNPEGKRKELLKGLKAALILQEEIEQIQELRKAKATLLNNIKETMASINSDYQSLKKLLPNIDNILQYTEQELAMLEGASQELASTSSVSDLPKEEPMPEKKTSSRKSPSKKKANESRMDRIQNNLKVIESRLKSI